MFSPAPARPARLSLLGSLGWASADPKPHTGSSDGDTAIELVSEVVTGLVLVWFGRQRRTTNWVCDGFDFFRGAADGLGCTKGLRRSRCDCSGGPTSRNGGFSPVKQSTISDKIAGLRGACHVQVENLPNSTIKLRERSPKRFLGNKKLVFSNLP